MSGRFEYLLDFEGFTEIGPGFFPSAKGMKQFGDFNDLEFVEAQLVARCRTEAFITSMCRSRFQGPEAVPPWSLPGLVETKFIETLLVEDQGSFCAVQFEGKVHLPAPGNPAGFKGAPAAVFEFCKYVGLIVYRNTFIFFESWDSRRFG